jgi:glycosyltransferase involved in cell wall biosynthesis
MNNGTVFQNWLKSELSERLSSAKASLGETELLKIDLHCHDYNSKVPDEALGRILGVPETWLPTEHLISTLRKSGMSATTVTNHNNARSCWELLDKGIDVLPGAEFSCHIPDLDVGVHVLTYGFNPEQEEKLKVLRSNIYDFLDFTSSNDLPTVLAHPLDFHAPHGLPPLEKYEKIFLLFNNFEVMNGQRDTWSSLLTWEWLNSFDREKLESLEKKFNFAASTFCSDPWRKSGVGGSDDHFGVFAGRSGTLFSTSHIDEAQRCIMKPSELALSALREGSVAPFGEWNDGRKLNLALLDYFAGLVLHLKDPGLGRILLHKGTPRQKMYAFAINNGIHEIRRHRYTMRFLKTFHGAVRGEKPSMMTRFLLRRYQPELLKTVERLITASDDGIGHLETPIAEELFSHFAGILSRRIEQKVSSLGNAEMPSLKSFDELVERLEIPSVVRTLVQPSERVTSRSSRKMSLPSLGEVFDGLSFPFLASALIAGSMFATSRVLHGKRPFSDSLAQQFPKLRPPQRVLWITDTFTDKNGVSAVLQLAQKYALDMNLPIDFLICHESQEPQANLKVVKPLSKFTLSLYPQQPFRIPNLAELQGIIENGGYSSIVCSTEGPMAAAAVYFKHAMRLPVWFYVHTDWIAFAQQNETLREVNLDRIRRIMRGLYSQFDGLFVLNSEQKKMFKGERFQFTNVVQTAHWASENFHRQPQLRKAGIAGLRKDDIVLLYAGRLSAEKGVFQLPMIYEAALRTNPKVRLVVAGTGPAESQLRELIPEAIFLGWQPQSGLCEIYNRADLLLLPSTFDTFGCVVLEAMSCGLPVCAYAVKGPADIIDHGVDGFLATNQDDFSHLVSMFVAEPEAFEGMRDQALARSKDYTPASIMHGMLSSLGIDQYEAKHPEGATQFGEDSSFHQTEKIPASIGDDIDFGTLFAFNHAEMPLQHSLPN